MLEIRRKFCPTILAICISFALTGCERTTSDKPSPKAAKQFLQLRGYVFDEKSFFAAVAANDVLAIKAFLVAGINPNATNEEGAAVIHSAASRGDLEVVKALVLGGADINQRDRQGNTAIFRAISAKQDDVTTYLLGQQNINLNAQGGNGTTVLMRYVWLGDQKIVSQLLARGADVRLKDVEGDTALHGAAQRGDESIAKMLLDKGADPNAKNMVGGTPLMWAGVYGHAGLARLLLQRGADPRLKDDDGITAAGWALKNKRVEVAQLLQEAEKRK